MAGLDLPRHDYPADLIEPKTATEPVLGERGEDDEFDPDDALEERKQIAIQFAQDKFREDYLKMWRDRDANVAGDWSGLS